MLRYSFVVVFSLLAGWLAAQPLTQTIRGKVVDTDTKYPLAGVTVVVVDLPTPLGANTGENGEFRIEKVPVGSHMLQLSYIGYQKVVRNNVEVSSAKEKILNIEMQEQALEGDQVEIVAERDGEARNEMAPVSARQFSVAETNLYAGSRGEPARMASNYAGVQGADDTRNDIVVRGNSPTGVLWRLEGLNIPNPNHFAIPGTGGGPVTVLNNKFLANSDFFTGAWPGEYANALGGVFDLRMRNGNNEQHEFSGQLGFLGAELTAEGPLPGDGGASYLAMYRYSTLAIFDFIGIDVGTNAIPQYQDGAFRLNFPQKNGANLAIWGMGGISDIEILYSDEPAPSEDFDVFAADTDRDQYFGSSLGVVGATYLYPINLNTYLKVGVGVSYQGVDTYHEQIYRRVEQNAAGDEVYVYDSLPPILDYRFNETKAHSYLSLQRKLAPGHTLKLGFNLDGYFMNYVDSVRSVTGQLNGGPKLLGDWRLRWDGRDQAVLVQPYVQYKGQLSDRLAVTAGLTSLYWSLNENSFSPVEPRVGLTYQLAEKQQLSFGAGLHSQIQTPYLYFYSQETLDGDPQEHNLDMGLSQSLHAVLGYDLNLARNMRLKVETYFQHLYNIPVEVNPSSFSLINAGSGFARFFPDTLENEGIGRNYGLELTLEKFFTQGYYFLVTGSLFDSKYQGSDGVWRNTTFNGRYAVNALVARELRVGERSRLQLGAKVTSIGGRWYGPVDETQSVVQNEIVYEDEDFNTLQFAPYFRFDLKVLYQWNRPKVTHELAIDFVNVFNTDNILTQTYVPDHPSGEPVQEEYQLGFLPIFYYKVDF